jgi:nitrate/nitrite transporter NarK
MNLAWFWLSLFALCYAAYTVWIILSPLVAPSHPLNVWLSTCDRYWGLAVPVTCGVALLSVSVGVYLRLTAE